MTLNQEQIRRMTEGGGGAVGGGGGSSIDPSALAGMATQAWVNQNYLSIEFFSKLFKAYNSANPSVEVLPNDTESTITNIKAMFGFWTEQYVSALGQNSGGGSGGATALTDLVDVAISSPTNGQALVYNATSGKWENQNIGGGSGTLSSIGLTMPTGFLVNPSTLTADGSFTVSFATGYALPTTSDVNKGVTAYGWGNHASAGYLTSVAFDDLTSHPTTLSGYGITDAYISGGTIYLGSNSITPLTSFTETDPTVPAWAKASTKPSYAFSEITGSVAFSQLPTLYWANVAVSSSSSNNTEPRFKTININGFTIEYDSTNQALKFNGTIYATGGVSALGAGSGGSGGATALSDLVDVSISSPTNGQVLKYNSTSGKWENAAESGGGGGGGTVTSITASTGLSGGTITTSGTIAINSTYQSYISHGETAYGWGDHAQAGYLTASDISDMATKTWVSNQGYLTSVAFSDLTSHPSTLSGYGITDAKIQNGTITLGSNTITPLTSFTETDPTVPAWAKASTKPSYAFSEITGSVAFSQLPTLYWANVAISNSSDKTTEPQFANVRLRNNTANYGSYLYFGDGSYCYLYEDTDDHLKVYGSKGVEITTGSGYDLTWGGNAVATQTWVTNQGYLTGITSSMVTTALGYTPLNNQTTFWGQTASSGVVQGTINAGNSGGYIIGFEALQMNKFGSLPNYGGFIDFHFNGADSYTSRIIEDASGQIHFEASNGIRIGNGVIMWDSTNNALKIQKSDGTSANLYATGGVSSLGMSAGNSSIDAMTFNYVTVNNRITLKGSGHSHYIYGDSNGCLVIDGSEYILFENDIDTNGNSINTNGGDIYARRFYLDSSRYIYLDDGTLKYFNGTTSKTIYTY